MGEYIDIGVQTPIFAYIILISSVAVGAVALLGFETENDDDDSDSEEPSPIKPSGRVARAEAVLPKKSLAERINEMNPEQREDFKKEMSSQRRR